eukprot:TRINITY_DN14865_c0_g1_i10.p1 TRINITY_DN14865_c0_g1~~TRINITY_DN14865_c0_g1_i10.p1  ORF type:complete len:418 (+),score=64.49 TRINITY_DN14865_c0_g1_i10:62-1255(+)
MDAAVPPARGYCHQCEAEVVATELEGGEFECPHCRESCVESPYDSFEQWEGTWQVRYDNGYTNSFTITDDGLLTLARVDDAGSGETHLVWVGNYDVRGSDGLFQMRLEGHYRAGVVEYFRRDIEAETDNIVIHHITENGTIVHGTAWHEEDGSQASDGLARVMDAMISGLAGGAVGAARAPGEADAAMSPEESEIQDLHRSVQSSLAQLAGQWPGLPGGERDWMRDQMQQWSVPLAGVISRHRPVLQALSHQMRIRPGSGGGAGGGATGGNLGALHFGQIFQTADGFFMRLPREQQEHTGVSRAKAAAWLDARSVDGSAVAVAAESGTVEDGEWQCPICFDCSTSELVGVCTDAAGKPAHIFHRQCVLDWLIRRDECPTCRRTPLVEEPSPGLAAAT